MRTEILARFVKFHQNLLKSKSFEVQVLVNLVSKDIRSTTAKNIALIEREAGKAINNLSPQQVRELVEKPAVPMNQEWRMPLLQKLLSERRLLETSVVNTDIITGVIDSLCSS